MRIARPAILWRFLQAELWRLLGVTAAVLVVVLAFGFTVKPLADGRLNVLDALKVMGLAVLPMLQYALPFAAGFAATMTYHRMSQDNELTACYAGGISHRSMLLPAAIGGFVLSLCLFGLADQAMPRLLKNIQELLTGSATRLVAASVERGQSMVSPDGKWILYADKFVPRPADPRTGEIERFELLGLVMLQRGEGAKVIAQAAAQRAEVWVYRRADADDAERSALTMVMRLRDSLVTRPGRASGQAGETEIRIQVPSNWRDNPKFLTMGELIDARNDPRRLNDVAGQLRSLAALLAERTAADRVRTALKRDGKLEMTVFGARTTVRLRAVSLAETPEKEGFALETRNGGIEVVTIFEDGRTRTQRAKKAWIAVPQAGEREESTIVLKLAEVATSGASVVDEDDQFGASAPAAGVLRTFAISNLAMPTDPMDEFARLDAWQLIETAKARLAKQPADPALERGIAQSQQRVRERRNEVLSIFHERIASSLACWVMVVLGGVMGMRLGSSVPLAVYLWSFLPALCAVLLISGGQRLTVAWGWPGLSVLYGGVIALLAVTWSQYQRLSTR